MKKIAILQPNYIPWKGVFEMIDYVDVFVFFDDVQYTVKDWRNRNIVKTPNGEIWISVPVKTKGLKDQLICDAEIITSEPWQKKHYKTIAHAYQKAPYFDEYKYILDELYLQNTWTKISELGIFSTKIIADALGISVEWAIASDYKCTGSKNGERVVNLCKVLDCAHFINGPSSAAYMDEKIFADANIKLDYFQYKYGEYPQLHPPFSHHVSALDLLFNCGPDSREVLI
jgi:hypothetical protein